MKPNWFVGLPIDPGAWFEPLTRDAPTAVRVFHPADVHLTVAFLGACGGQRAATAWQLLASYAAAPIDIRLARLEPMGNPRRPSALSALIDTGREAVSKLTLDMRAPLLAAAGAEPDTREPLPHVTVARPMRKCSPEQRRNAIAWATAKPAIGASVSIDRVALFTWSDDRRTRQFRVVAEHQLGPP